MGDAPSPPPVQSADSVAKQAQHYNQQAQQNSAVSQTTPYGSLNYSIDPKTGQITAKSTLSAAQQGLLNTLQGTQQSAGTAGQHLLSSANYGSGVPDLSGDASSIVTQNLNNYTNYLTPFFNQQNSQLDTQLRNQGIVPGTQAYQQAMNNQQQSQNQTVSGYLAQMQPIAYNQAVSSYQLPLQTASQLAALGAPSGYGSSNVNTPQQAPVNYAGIVGQQGQLANQQYQQQVQQNSGMLSGLFGIGGSILGGPVGGALGSAVGGLFGGSGGSGYGNSWTPMITVGG